MGQHILLPMKYKTQQQQDRRTELMTHYVRQVGRPGAEIELLTNPQLTGYGDRNGY
jgi:hypothetical protein